MSSQPYGYGYGQYQSQPTGGYPAYTLNPVYGQPLPVPTQPQSQNSNAGMPGLHATPSQSQYDQNQGAIPGLAFGQTQTNLPTGWAMVPSPGEYAPVATDSYSPAAVSNPAANPPSDAKQGNAAPKNRLKALPSQPEEDTTEEGELSESGFNDFYEPDSSGRDRASREQNSDEYEPVEAVWQDRHSVQRTVARDAALPGNAFSRDRSGSYSPHLSPAEVQVVKPPTNRSSVHTVGGSRPVSTGTAISGAVAEAAVPQDAVVTARKRARDAVMSLQTLNVRFKDYVEAGVDEKVLKSIFDELGLRTEEGTQPPPGSQQHQIPGLAQSPTPTPGSNKPSSNTLQHQAKAPSKAVSATAPTPVPAPAPLVAATTAPKDKGEERKDRIARLLAEKAAKASQAAAAQQNPIPSGPALPPSQQSQAASLTDKQLQQQQKKEALQKSREARAQRATRKDSTANTASSPNSSSPNMAATDIPKQPAAWSQPGFMPSKPPLQPSADTTTTIPLPRPQDATPASVAPAKDGVPPVEALAGGIPGLFSSSVALGATNQRKRPVASDFVDEAPANSFKRPFGETRRERFLIHVSDESDDDDDIEMEIASGDESIPTQQTGTPLRRTTSFRNVPPLSDNVGQRQFSSPVQNGGAAPPPSNLEHMNKEIEAMKRRIALAEARKKVLQARSSNGQAFVRPQSNGATPEAVSDARLAKDSPLPLQPLDSTNSSDALTGRSSPVQPDFGSMKLLKPAERRKAALPGDRASRTERVRVLSQSIPSLDRKMQTQKSKLRLLQSQMARLQKEIEEDTAEQQQLAAELDSLQQEEETGEAEEAADVDVDVDMSMAPVSFEVVTPADIPPAPPVFPVKSIDQHDEPLNGLAVQNDVSNSIESHEAPYDPSSITGEGVSAAVTEQAVGVFPQGSTMEEPTVANDEAEADRPTPFTGNEDQSPAQATDDGEPTPAKGRQATAEVEDAELDDASMLMDNSGSEQATSAASTPNQLDVALADADDADVDVDASVVSLAEAEPEQAMPEHISVGIDESNPDQGLRNPREVPQGPPKRREPEKAGFTSYESPLQYFRDFRYHPEFHQAVAGGLRSLTYSNKIDVDLPMCPDQLAGRQCPKGTDCEYQHFESMKLPDDQILLQLGGTSLEGAERAQYNNGLRELLHNMRSRSIKDFPTIAQGIVDYHNRFIGDPSKVLSLGDIAL